MKEQSALMRILRCMGFESVAWSLRRLHCPVSRDDLVLEVGSGGNPFPRSNVLVDAHEATRQRYWEPLKADRPVILSYAEKLPFKDKAFDFVIACHVLEHSARPEKFLSELQRVAKAGYIETPSAFLERINPYRDHRLEVSKHGEQLVIRKKQAWIVDREIVELYEHEVKTVITRKLMPDHPFAFHTRHFWADRIDCRIVNPSADADWPAEGQDSQPGSDMACPGGHARRLLRNLAQAFFAQSRRNATLDLVSLMKCPLCDADVLKEHDGHILCNKCGSVFERRRGILVMSKS